ncbi:DNA-binding transcriptional regulator, MerR family [Thermomonospora echinospora]|uniref:DNA-binding transcriptional regulator, MerR family n=1 Tax=Thermomonospora echinospora TaxID=1992 RepID=A0A1H6A200_9ACTN|nr:MerR family transcriptional regulator [Thermomonospora echinospora]SEG42471.1 DNA-binding transcriptional regulator, MerR family [Thermomonospora echinospora]
MELTVDELAARAGVSVRTVRYYAGRGLLPPPRLRGRTGLYGAEHLARLELVRELQSLGLTLAAIEHHLQRIPEDAPPEDLALQRALLSPWTPDRPEEMDRHELDRRAGRHLDDDVLKRLEALGVVEQASGDTVRVISTGLLRVGAELAALPLPLETLAASHEAVERHTTALAEELQRNFQDSVVRPYRERGRQPREREMLLEMANRLKPLMIQSLVTSFQHAVDRAIRKSVPGDEDDRD